MNDSLSQTFDDRSIGSYLETLGSGSPAPGGGSAAGLAGAMGCALGSMVCNLTLARAESASVRKLQQSFTSLQTEILEQATADESAFSAYRAAAALPRSSEDEKSIRRNALESALVGAAEVPGRMAILGMEALAALRETALIGSAHALGDVITGGYLLQAMVWGSLENIEANAVLMKQSENRTRFMAVTTSVRHDLTVAMTSIESAVAARRA